MHKKIMLLITLTLFISKNAYATNTKKIIFPEENKNIEFKIDIAKTTEEKSLGLMYRKTLLPKNGMLFCFNDNIYPITMWMKNTNIPLDILFFNIDKNLIGIHKNAEPYSLKSIYAPQNTTYVLEINAGEIDKLNLTQYKKWQLNSCD